VFFAVSQLGLIALAVLPGVPWRGDPLRAPESSLRSG
jgi:hypothetical protein